MNLKLNICLTDIDKTKIFVSKTGKKYLTIYCNENRNGLDQYGNSHYLTTGKDADGKTQFVGNGKPSEYEAKQQTENATF